MGTLSHDFETVDLSGGYFIASRKSMYIDIPEPIFPKGWMDEVGRSLYVDLEYYTKKFKDAVEKAFNNLKQIDESIRADSFKYDANAVERQIESLTVK